MAWLVFISSRGTGLSDPTLPSLQCILKLLIPSEQQSLVNRIYSHLPECGLNLIGSAEFSVKAFHKKVRLPINFKRHFGNDFQPMIMREMGHLTDINELCILTFEQ